MAGGRHILLCGLWEELWRGGGVGISNKPTQHRWNAISYHAVNSHPRTAHMLMINSAVHLAVQHLHVGGQGVIVTVGRLGKQVSTASPILEAQHGHRDVHNLCARECLCTPPLPAAVM